MLNTDEVVTDFERAAIMATNTYVLWTEYGKEEHIKHRRDCDHPGAGRRCHDPLGLVAGEEEKVMGQMRRLTYYSCMKAPAEWMG